jgi:hypothetical protein
MAQAATTTNTTTVILPRGQTRGAFEPASVDVTARTAELVWTTGARVLRHGLYDGPWLEELSLADDAVDLSRLNAGAPLLAAHRSAELDQVLGVVESAWLARANGSREGRAHVRFSKRPEVDGVLTDVKDGILKRSRSSRRASRRAGSAASSTTRSCSPSRTCARPLG